MVRQQFKIISADPDYCDAFMGSTDSIEVKIQMDDVFADAVQTGKLQVILTDDPYGTEIDSDEISAINTRKIAHSLYGFDGNYDWDNNVFNVYITLDCVGKNLFGTPMDKFQKAVEEVLDNPESAPKPPKLG